VDVNGKEYLDANSSIWTNLHGHNHPKITEALKEQLDRIAHSSFLGLSNVPAIQLAEKLSVLTGLPRVFYSDDGSTAMEVAIKMALQYWQHCGQAWRTKFVAFTEAYHGDTIGTMSVGGIKLFHDAYRPLTFDVLRASTAEDLQRLLQAHAGTVAGVCIEPLIQGAAGMKVWPAGMLAEVRRQCTEHNVLLIADEVLTGFGRTGTMFACEKENVVPDLLALAKGLTGGYLPLAATLTSEQIFNAFLGEYHEFKTFFHGHSYTGNQLGCAAALANLSVFEEEKTLVKLQTKIGWMRDHLERCRPLTTRQCGFIGAVEVGDFPLEKQMGMKVCRAMRERGVLTRPIGNVVIIMPPYCITEGQLARIFTVLAESVQAEVS
jgi:adenosylmethionine-8-amino-7-oxononanoate aminotransferase